MLEPDDEVISEAHDDHVAPRLLPPPSLSPEVEHIMKIEVRQERADTPTLHGPHLTACPLPILQHTGPEPFLDEPHDAPVRHTVLDELHQPSVVESVEEAPDVGVEHPVHLLRHDPDRQRIQRLMRSRVDAPPAAVHGAG